ncbi:hypothetical protein [Erythrobacter phage vB_EliS-L02]|nr:hypothetical protein [Erythrobacter phage vB_EliS-L02]
MSALLIKPPHRVRDEGSSATTVFLAGTIDNGASRDWQQEVFDLLNKQDKQVHVYNPRRDDWDPNLEPIASNKVFREQVEWELDYLEEVDTIFMHFEPGSKSPITLLELGMWLERDPYKLIVSCPDGFWRKGNVEIVCKRVGIEVHNEIELAYRALLNAVA